MHKEKEGSERVARICVRRGRAHVHEEKPGVHACARGGERGGVACMCGRRGRKCTHVHGRTNLKERIKEMGGS